MRQFTAVALLVGFAASAPPIPAGFDYLGNGYDILVGNPFDTEGFGDLGYKAKIFEWTFKDGKTTGDGKWSIPDETTESGNPACSENLTNHTIRSMSDYNSATNFSFNLNATFENATYTKGDEGLGKIAAVLSVDTHNVHQMTQKNASIFYLESFTCSIYTLSMGFFAHPKISDNFKMGVMDFLPTEYSEDQYMTFLSNFGTHVVNSLDVGGRWGWQVSIDSSYVHQLDEEGHDVDVGLNVAAQVSAGFDVKDHRELSNMHEVTKFISANSTFNIGGDFATDPQLWKASVAAKPMPLKPSFVPLHMLLGPLWFPDADKDKLAKKAQALEYAINYKYCQYLKKQKGTGYDYVVCPEAHEKNEGTVIVV